MSNSDTPRDGAVAYRMAYGPGDNPFNRTSAARRQWDTAFWAEHDAAGADAIAAAQDERVGMEEAYGSYLDMDAVSQGMYDDDPSPYDGNYSEM